MSELINFDFVMANENDLVGISEIEMEFFDNYAEKYDIEFLKKWYKYNPKMFLVVKNTFNGEVVGFTLTVPITESTYNKLFNGEIHDMDKFDFNDVLTGSKAKYYYFADICLSKDKMPRGMANKLRALVAMLSGIQNHLDKTGVEHIILTAITAEGVSTSRGMGFEPIRETTIPGYNRPLVTMILDVNSKVRDQMFERMDTIKKRLKKGGK